MDMKALTPELLDKAKQATSAEALRTLADENGIALTPEQAGECFARLHEKGDLTDDELNAVAGGSWYATPPGELRGQGKHGPCT